MDAMFISVPSLGPSGIYSKMQADDLGPHCEHFSTGRHVIGGRGTGPTIALFDGRPTAAAEQRLSDHTSVQQINIFLVRRVAWRGRPVCPSPLRLPSPKPKILVRKASKYQALVFREISSNVLRTVEGKLGHSHTYWMYFLAEHVNFWGPPAPAGVSALPLLVR
jgi:hypothetical protein